MARGTEKRAVAQGVRREDLARLIESIQAGGGLAGGGLAGGDQPHSEHAHGPRPASALSTGWPPVDATLGDGLARGAVHEWFADATPPLALMVHLMRRAVAAERQGRRVAWVGRRVWPYIPAMGRELLEASLFVDIESDSREDAGRWWAVDLALRSGVCVAVVADGAGLHMAGSRRLQLASASGETLGLLMRPARERCELSVAATRWHVTPVAADPAAPAETRGPRWTLTLVRCKGRQTPGAHGGDEERSWMVEQDRDQGVVGVSAVVVRGPDATASPRSNLRSA